MNLRSDPFARLPGPSREELLGEAASHRAAGRPEPALEVYWRLSAWREMAATLDELSRPIEAGNAWLRLLPFLPTRTGTLTPDERQAAAEAARCYLDGGLARPAAALHLNLGDLDAACATLDLAGYDRLAEEVRLTGVLPDNPWPAGRLSSRPPPAALPVEATAEHPLRAPDSSSQQIGGAAGASLNELLAVPVSDPHFLDVADLVTRLVSQQELMSLRVAIFLEPLISGEGLESRQPDPDTLYRLGRLYERIGFVEKATLAYAHARAADPLHHAARVRAARLREPKGGLDSFDVLDSLSMTLEAEPSEAEQVSLAEAVATATQSFELGPLGPGAEVAERFELGRALGEGGGGVVFAAWDRVEERDVALKVLRAGRGEMRAVARFQREMEICRDLVHPNIVRTFDSGQWRELHWIAMERLDGIDLGVLVRRIGRPLPVRSALGLLIQVLQGLEHAHSHGIVHRDIKPSNIFVLRGSHRVKVLDFGLALAGDGPRVTRVGTTVGSPRYMAPERLRGVEEVGPWTDLYSAGVAFYRMLTADMPYRSKAFAALLAEVEERVPPSPSTLNPLVPPALDAVVDRLLAKEPERRYQSAAAVLAALQPLRQGT